MSQEIMNAYYDAIEEKREQNGFINGRILDLIQTASEAIEIEHNETAKKLIYQAITEIEKRKKKQYGN